MTIYNIPRLCNVNERFIKYNILIIVRIEFNPTRLHCTEVII